MDIARHPPQPQSSNPTLKERTKPEQEDRGTSDALTTVYTAQSSPGSPCNELESDQGREENHKQDIGGLHLSYGRLGSLYEHSPSTTPKAKISTWKRPVFPRRVTSPEARAPTGLKTED